MTYVLSAAGVLLVAVLLLAGLIVSLLLFPGEPMP
jgi:hypothetical protein